MWQNLEKKCSIRARDFCKYQMSIRGIACLCLDQRKTGGLLLLPFPYYPEEELLNGLYDQRKSTLVVIASPFPSDSFLSGYSLAVLDLATKVAQMRIVPYRRCRHVIS